MFLFLPVSVRESSWPAGKLSGRPKCGLEVRKGALQLTNQQLHVLDHLKDIAVTAKEDVGVFLEAFLPLLKARSGQESEQKLKILCSSVLTEDLLAQDGFLWPLSIKFLLSVSRF